MEMMRSVPTFRDGLPKTRRPSGIHPLASVGGAPESRGLSIGDAYYMPVIHPTVLVHAFCTIDGGLEQPTRIGANSFLMARVHVGHDCQIGSDCEFGAGVVLCGHVQIGNGARLGGNTWVKPRVKIGELAVIGGGSVVVKDVPAGETWVGNPARRLVKGNSEPLVLEPCSECGILGGHRGICSHSWMRGGNPLAQASDGPAEVVGYDPHFHLPLDDDAAAWTDWRPRD